MIKFFRRIRRKLIDDGNLNRYLIYAIGEIVLVVAGVLIAIQLNNANEQRKSENNGTQILMKLKQELEQDIIYFDSLSREYVQWQLQTKYILDTLLTTEPSELNSLKEYSIGRGSVNFLHINKSSFNELMISGNNIELRNQDLKNEIVRHFQSADIELNKLNLDNERFNKWYYDMTDMTLLVRLKDNRNLEYEDWSWLKDPRSETYRDYEARIVFFQSAIRANRKAIKTLKDKCQNIIRKIEEELKE